MARRRLLLLLKPLDVYPCYPSNGLSRFANPKVRHDNPSDICINERGRVFRINNCTEPINVVNYLNDRRTVHNDAIKFCQNILQKKFVDWETVYRSHLSEPIRDVDLVVTIGGDGTLLQASRFMDNSIPVLGVNSDPTKAEEVELCSEDFDATRSTGYLCAATVENFETILDNILENHAIPSEVSRMSIRVNSELLSTHPLNDVLIAHPCPAAVSRFSFRIWRQGEQCSPLVSSRSSGFRVSTAAGSTAAMLSAGGFAMPILSKDLQYMVREPIAPRPSLDAMHGVVKHDESMEIKCFSKEGAIYLDGFNVVLAVAYGDTIELSSKAPILKVFLPSHLLS